MEPLGNGAVGLIVDPPLGHMDQMLVDHRLAGLAGSLIMGASTNPTQAANLRRFWNFR